MRLTDTPQFSDSKFYKYRPWNQYSEDVIAKNEIFFSSPAEVNDPFDCRFPDIVPPTDEQLTAYMKYQYLNLRSPNRDRSRVHGGVMLLNSLVEANMGTHGPPSWEATINRAKEMILEQSSFCSLSSISNSSLMFAHYAAGHTGVCFEFHYTLEFSFGHVEAVIYEDKFSAIDLFNDPDCDDDCLVQAAIYQKHLDWAYEKEWRIFNLGEMRGVYTFDQRCLSGIIFGCKMPEKDRERARKLVQNREMKPKIYEAIMEPDGYSLEVRELT